MNIRDKNPVLKQLILRLKKQAGEKQAPFWRAVADSLNRPRRVGVQVPLSRLDTYASTGVVVVPGTVLATGTISRPLTVGAYKFTAAAEKKISGAGGSCLTLEQCAEKYPDGKGVQLIG